MLTLLHPWFLLFLPAPWIVRLLLPPLRQEPAAVRVPFGPRIKEALRSLPAANRAARRSAPFLTPSIIWILAVAALARPQWLEPPVESSIPTRDLLLLVDLSGSMQEQDFSGADGSPLRRLDAVKEVLSDFLSRRAGDRVGLVVFGNAPFLQTPFTTDLDLARRLLDETDVGMAGPRTAFGDAIGLGISLFEQSDAPSRTIIALTDGNDTDSNVPPVEAARIAAERDIRIHTVAIGDPETVGEEQLDEATLRQVATDTRGSFFLAASRSELEGIYEELDQIETREINVVRHRPRRDLFHWPLLAALLAWLGSEIAALAATRFRSPAVRSPAAVRVDPVSGRLEITRP